jgi:ATP-binding cassette subfamily B protein
MLDKVGKLKILLPDVGTLPKESDGIVRWMWFFLKPYRNIIVSSSLLRLFRYIAYALITYFFSVLIDQLQSGKAIGNPHVFWMNTAKIAVFYLFSMTSFMLLVYEILALDKVQRGLTLFSVSHLLALPLDWHEQQGSGAKLQRILQARENIRQIYFIFSRNLLFFVGEVTGIVIAVLAMHVPGYMLLLFAGYIASYVTVFWLGNFSMEAFQNEHSVLKEKLVSRIYDFVSLIRVAKAFSLSDYVMNRSSSGEEEAHDVMRKIRFRGFTRWSALNVIVWFWVGLIILIGIRQVFEKEITVGAFSAVIFMAYRMWNTLEEIVVAQTDYYDYKSGFLRIRETLSAPVQHHDIAPVVQTPQNWPKIECRDLAFSYHADQPVLNNINLTIPRGNHIALIGHSGAGKSTMVKLLMKQIMSIGGDIVIGDVSLKNIDSNDWLSHLALVPQDVELMNATLRENILLDRTDIDENFYRECLRKSYLEEFIAGLPLGDATEIGERGVKLSGGQKQRLGIARALARNADIIILDEATSSLDSESEAFIQRAMETAFTDKTVIVIAHRLSTIRHADTIYVFDKGVIAESGNFAALEKSNGIFSRLWAMQSNGFIAD